MHGFIKNNRSATTVPANSAMPTKSRSSVLLLFRLSLGKRLRPSMYATAAMGTLMARVVRQPPSPMSSPPMTGPMTAMVCVEIARMVRMAAGLSLPVRLLSSRMRRIAVG